MLPPTDLLPVLITIHFLSVINQAAKFYPGSLCLACALRILATVVNENEAPCNSTETAKSYPTITFCRNCLHSRFCILDNVIT